MQAAYPLALALTATVGGGCSGPGPEDWPAGRPRIVTLAFVEQRPQDPLSLLFRLDFEDSDGDVGLGRLELEVADAPQATLAMQDVFAAQFPPLASTSTLGSFEIYVQIRSEVDPGDRIRVGFLLEDGAGRRSNRPSVVLEALDPIGGSSQGGGS